MQDRMCFSVPATACARVALVALMSLCVSTARAAELPRLLENVTLTADSEMTPGAPYVVRGTLTVSPKIVLTIEPRVQVRFERGAKLLVNGELHARSPMEDIVLRSDVAVPAPGSWEGIELGPMSNGVVLDGVLIEHAVVAVLITGGTPQETYVITRSTLRDFSQHAVRSGEFSTTLPARGTRKIGVIAGNLIENPNGGGEGIAFFGHPAVNAAANLTISDNTIRGLVRGLALDMSSPIVTGNTIEQNDIGVQIRRASPKITGGNRIVGNITGILRNGGNDTQPIINGNAIFGSTALDYESIGLPGGADPYRVELFPNAESNHWGTTDPLAIAAKLSRSVDFVPFVDEAGKLVPAEGLLLGVVRPVSGDVLSIPEGSQVLLLGNALVPSGTTLEIGAGSTVRATSGQGLGVDGTLRVLGRPGALVTIAPTSETWRGIDIRPDSTESSIEGAVLQNVSLGVPSTTRAAIDVRGSELVLRDTDIVSFTAAAVLYRDGAKGMIQNVTIENSENKRNGVRSGTGILIQNSSPDVVDSKVSEAVTGVELNGSSTSLLSGNTLRDNNVGILLEGMRGRGADPSPRINGNDLLENRTRANRPVENLVLMSFAPTQTTPVDARGNFWGVTTEPEIRATIVTRGANVPPVPVDITGFLTAPVNP